MSVFIFQSAKDSTIVGFTEDPTGGNLPVELAPWRSRGTPAIPLGRSDEIRAALETDGFYLAQGTSLTDPPVLY